MTKERLARGIVMSNSEERRTPVHVLIVLPTKPLSDLLFQRAKKAYEGFVLGGIILLVSF